MGGVCHMKISCFYKWGRVISFSLFQSSWAKPRDFSFSSASHLLYSLKLTLSPPWVSVNLTVKTASRLYNRYDPCRPTTAAWMALMKTGTRRTQPAWNGWLGKVTRMNPGSSGAWVGSARLGRQGVHSRRRTQREYSHYWRKSQGCGTWCIQRQTQLEQGGWIRNEMRKFSKWRSDGRRMEASTEWLIVMY